MTKPSPGGAAEFFEELRREYLLEASARLSELRKDLAAFQSGEPDAANSLKVRFHRLAGSGGSYGFPEISAKARAAEHWVIASPTPSAANATHLGELIAEIAAAFDSAAQTLGLPQAPPKPAAFGWQATIIGDPSHLADRVHTTLVDAQYTVHRQPMGANPADTLVSERPDVAVILVGEVEQTAETVRRWAQATGARPASVILVAPIDSVDPLGKPFAMVDGIVAPDRVETELLSSVRALGRAATAPRSILVVDRDDHEATRALVRSLEGLNVRVVQRAGGLAARETIKAESHDLIVVDWKLVDTTAAALIRWIRRQPAHRLTPIVVSLATTNDDDRLAAIRAGADDTIARTIPPGYLCQLLMARIERARAVRNLAHRDDLTGLLNHEAMIEELDRALNLARRTNEALAFLMIDLDHFRRINEQFGQQVGDAALVHVARLVASAVRSSDLVARMGGEELGVLIRRCRPTDASRVAEKIHAIVRDSPCPVGDQTIAVKASVGVACHPEHGFGGAELLRAADKALAAAKAAGRDRVLVAT